MLSCPTTGRSSSLTLWTGTDRHLSVPPHPPARRSSLITAWRRCVDSLMQDDDWTDGGWIDDLSWMTTVMHADRSYGRPMTGSWCTSPPPRLSSIKWPLRSTPDSATRSECATSRPQPLPPLTQSCPLARHGTQSVFGIFTRDYRFRPLESRVRPSSLSAWL